MTAPRSPPLLSSLRTSCGDLVRSSGPSPSRSSATRSPTRSAMPATPPREVTLIAVLLATAAFRDPGRAGRAARRRRARRPRRSRSASAGARLRRAAAGDGPGGGRHDHAGERPVGGRRGAPRAHGPITSASPVETGGGRPGRRSGRPRSRECAGRQAGKRTRRVPSSGPSRTSKPEGGEGERRRRVLPPTARSRRSTSSSRSSQGRPRADARARPPPAGRPADAAARRGRTSPKYCADAEGVRGHVRLVGADARVQPAPSGRALQRVPGLRRPPSRRWPAGAPGARARRGRRSPAR